MLTLHHAQSAKTPSKSKIGLAIAGGGPVGAIYELGALRALDEAIPGLRLHDLEVYVGVSAGGFIAAGLANRISSAEMCRIFMDHAAAQVAFEPEKLLKPAYREYLVSARRAPRVLTDTLMSMLRNPMHASVSKIMGSLGKVIPSGIFDNDSLHAFLSKVFAATGSSNDFRDLKKKLYIVAVELDNGAAIRFGDPATAHVPISRAVQASAALPGMYPPVKIDGKYYVDGALRRTLHASAALDEGIDLLLAVNPLVPFESESGPEDQLLPVSKLMQGGLPQILSQTFRSMIQSRMNAGFRRYRKSHPDADLMLIEPDRSDEKIFFTNIFSFASRAALCEHAYQVTRRDLLQRSEQLNMVLARHGLQLDLELLRQNGRTLNDSLQSVFHGRSVVARKLHQALEDLEWSLQKRANC